MPSKSRCVSGMVNTEGKEKEHNIITQEVKDTKGNILDFAFHHQVMK